MQHLQNAGGENSSIAILPHGMSTRAIAPLILNFQSHEMLRSADDGWFVERLDEASASKQPALFLLSDKKGIRHNVLFNSRRPLPELVREAIEAKVLKHYPRAKEMVL